MRLVVFPRRVGLVAVPGVRGAVDEFTFSLVDGDEAWSRRVHDALAAGIVVPGWHLTVCAFTREEGEWRRRIFPPPGALAAFLAAFLHENDVEPADYALPTTPGLVGWVSADGTEFSMQTLAGAPAPLQGAIIVETMLEHARVYEPFGAKKVRRVTTREID